MTRRSFFSRLLGAFTLAHAAPAVVEWRMNTTPVGGPLTFKGIPVPFDPPYYMGAQGGASSLPIPLDVLRRYHRIPGFANLYAEDPPTN